MLFLHAGHYLWSLVYGRSIPGIAASAEAMAMLATMRCWRSTEVSVHLSGTTEIGIAKDTGMVFYAVDNNPIIRKCVLWGCSITFVWEAPIFVWLT